VECLKDDKALATRRMAELELDSQRLISITKELEMEQKAHSEAVRTAREHARELQASAERERALGERLKREGEAVVELRALLQSQTEQRESYQLRLGQMVEGCRLDDMNRRAAELQQMLHDAWVKLEASAAQLQESVKVQVTLESELSEQRRNLESAHQCAAELRTELEAQKALVREAHTKQASLSAGLEQKTREANHLAAVNADLDAVVATLKAKSETSEKQRAELGSLTAALRKDSEHDRHVIEELKTKMLTEAMHSEQQLERKARETADLVGSLQQEMAKCSALDKEVAVLRTHHDALRVAIDEYKEKVALLEKERRDVQAIEIEFGAVKLDFINFQKAAAEQLRREMGNASEKEQDLQKRMNNMSEKLAVEMSKAASLTTAVECLKDDKALATRRMAELELDAQRLISITKELEMEQKAHSEAVRTAREHARELQASAERERALGERLESALLQLSDASSKSASLESAHSALAESRDRQTAVIIDLQRQHNELVQQQKDLEQQLLRETAKSAETKKECEHVRLSAQCGEKQLIGMVDKKVADEMRDRINSLEQSIAQATALLETKNSEILAVSAKSAEKDLQIADLKHRYQQEASRSAEIRRESETLAKTIESENRALKETISSKEMQLADINERHKSELARSAASDAQVAALQEQLLKLEHSIRDMRQQCEQLRADATRCEGLQSEVHELIKDRDFAQRQAAERGGELQAALENERASSEKVRWYSERVSQEESRSRTMEQELASSKGALADAKQRAARLEHDAREVEHTRSELQALQKSLAEASRLAGDKSREASTALQQERAAHEKNQELSEKLAQALAKLSALETEEGNLRSVCKEQRETLEELSRENKNAKISERVKEEKIVELARKLNEAQQQVRTLQSALGESTGQLAFMKDRQVAEAVYGPALLSPYSARAMIRNELSRSPTRKHD
jgi:chromosome segregation protein